MEEYVQGLSDDELKQLKKLVNHHQTEINWKKIWEVVMDMRDPNDPFSKYNSGPEWERQMRRAQWALNADLEQFITNITPLIKDKIGKVNDDDLIFLCERALEDELQPQIKAKQDQIKQGSGQKIKVVYNPNTGKYIPQ